jgi:hypothetical protein
MGSGVGWMTLTFTIIDIIGLRSDNCRRSAVRGEGKRIQGSMITLRCG